MIISVFSDSLPPKVPLASLSGSFKLHKKEDVNVYLTSFLLIEAPSSATLMMKTTCFNMAVWMVLIMPYTTAWRVGQPPKNVWFTLAKSLKQENLCLSMGSVNSPLSSCLVGVLFKIHAPSPPPSLCREMACSTHCREMASSGSLGGMDQNMTKIGPRKP